MPPGEFRNLFFRFYTLHFKKIRSIVDFVLLKAERLFSHQCFLTYAMFINFVLLDSCFSDLKTLE